MKSRKEQGTTLIGRLELLTGLTFQRMMGIAIVFVNFS